MTAQIGIMQGRLLPMVDERIQSFPGVGWEREFPLAAEIGFDSIELTIEMASLNSHPVTTKSGQAALRGLSMECGVELAGLCCDTFMEVPLTAMDASIRARARTMLETLVRHAATAGLPMVELPMLGPNSLAECASSDGFGAILDGALEIAEAEDIDILLETDLAPAPFAELMRRHAHPCLGVNYDMGNSTYFGFDPREEIRAYHEHIRNVHVKDCTQADYSVPLGTGETEMETVFALLAEHGYSGGFVLQAARGGDDVAVARDYLDFTRTLVAGPVSQGETIAC